jgi:hexosaminidase
MIQKVLYIPFLLLLSLGLQAQQSNIFPQPAQFTYTRSLPFQITAATTIGGNNKEAQKIAQTLANDLSRPTGYTFKVAAKGTIQLNINKTPNAELGDEGYSLRVTNTAITIDANKPAGLFYGTQSLLQMLPAAIESKTKVAANWSVAACQITDYPRFGWRGLMLDVSRHFFSKEDVMRYIDRMAKYKYNVLHWHLTDDNGWRVEIKSLPKLTQVGACRVPRYGKFGDHEAPKEGEPATDCGFYTQEEVKAIVAYAAERNIQILPEIDVPGHSAAAVAAYPELCCTDDKTMKVNPGSNFAEWYGNGKFKMLIDNTLDPSDPKVYEFLDKVFTEVAALFPFPYIHAGGDECYHGYWEKDANCQALMQKEGLKTTHELQSYFTKKTEKIIQSKGKKLIGWDEILEGGLAPDAAVMSWRGLEGGIEAAKQGHYVVMTPSDFVYIDLLQGDPLVEPDQTAYKQVRLKQCYDFEPVPEDMDAKYVLGGQACLWTEKILSIRQAEYMTYPRALATADMFWSPKGTKNWDSFTNRMEMQMERLDVAEINYARSCFDPVITATQKEDGKLYANVVTEVNNLDVYYTLDESMPDRFSPKYTAPVFVPEGNSVTFKAVTYRNGKPIGKTIAVPRAVLLERKK